MDRPTIAGGGGGRGGGTDDGPRPRLVTLGGNTIEYWLLTSEAPVEDQLALARAEPVRSLLKKNDRGRPIDRPMPDTRPDRQIVQSGIDGRAILTLIGLPSPLLPSFVGVEAVGLTICTAQPLGVVALSDVLSVSVKAGGSEGGLYGLVVTGQFRSYTLWATQSVERDHWRSAISTAVDDWQELQELLQEPADTADVRNPNALAYCCSLLLLWLLYPHCLPCPLHVCRACLLLSCPCPHRRAREVGVGYDGAVGPFAQTEELSVEALLANAKTVDEELLRSRQVRPPPRRHARARAALEIGHAPPVCAPGANQRVVYPLWPDRVGQGASRRAVPGGRGGCGGDCRVQQGGGCAAAGSSRPHGGQHRRHWPWCLHLLLARLCLQQAKRGRPPLHVPLQCSPRHPSRCDAPTTIRQGKSDAH